MQRMHGTFRREMPVDLCGIAIAGCHGAGEAAIRPGRRRSAVVPGFGHPGIGVPGAGDMADGGEGHMGASDQRPVSGEHVEEPAPGLDRERGIDVEDHAGLGSSVGVGDGDAAGVGSSVWAAVVAVQAVASNSTAKVIKR